MLYEERRKSSLFSKCSWGKDMAIKPDICRAKRREEPSSGCHGDPDVIRLKEEEEEGRMDDNQGFWRTGKKFLGHVVQRPNWGSPSCDTEADLCHSLYPLKWKFFFL